ncbi:hypothetical protein [Streptomyces sp. NPDC007100]|uniref:hypothetical protein n=1 Tax=Streptomyces sp. NPDC007100 TaxID=3155602 RepID=UPI0033D53FCA
MADIQQADAADEQVEEQAGRGRADKRAERRTARLAKEIAAFAASHGGSAEGQLAHIARGSIRIALVGADGQWGNLVAETRDIARAAAERAGVALHDEFDGDLAAKVRTGPYEWSRMAGIQVGGPANT